MIEELRAHLRRLALWSGLWLAGGGAGALLAKDEGVRAFFGWNAGWCAVNLIICVASGLGKPPADRRRFREFLMLNEGLNVGYIGVGLTLAFASPSVSARAAGWAIAVQGAALLVLDAWLLGRVEPE
jgi:hypothetical protein